MILSDLAKYSMTQSVARSLCDSWASCQYGGWNYNTLHCGTIMTLISPGDCILQCGSGIVTVNSPSGSTLQCDTWLWDDMPLNSPSGSTLQRDTYLWNHDIEFAMWEHPAMLQVAVGWHAIEFAQTSAILEFYIWFRFRAHHRSRHVILHQSAKFYPNRTILGRKKWRNVDFKDGGSQPSWILGIQWVMDNGFFVKGQLHNSL